jgi:hypothetical protein
MNNVAAAACKGIANVAAKSSFTVALLGYILCGLLSNTNAQAQTGTPSVSMWLFRQHHFFVHRLQQK